MYTKTFISSTKIPSENRALVIRSHHNRSKPKNRIYTSENRKESEFTTKSYNDSLQRSFNNAKKQIFFNPDMQYFVTLTYKGIEKDVDKAMMDVKNLVRLERRRGNDLKYIYVFEWQKRGSLHIHMISNKRFTTHKNKNNYDSLTYWKHGFTSMLHIKDFDENFKPYLYLFKYMRKAQRIGKSFVHSSRNLKNYEETEKVDYMKYVHMNMERNIANLPDGNKLAFYYNYLKKDDIIQT